ncbi:MULTISPECIES: monovalent cation/H+ antiporter subunit D family protein [unclassified Corynebacterium]|uniref:monovalent cation/H+ antiporter subunit D family protein n=1 Tax=unclassified Corynebacterium TaxID=2624378 RepID=UPI001C445295|nr:MULTISPECIES: monovalent cation/H+ antiporter subunit D family protein [unclassified Corynebacterium]MBV7282406.1 monovalent cation/H+ antiporter subunit D family protein [Corynebacterium sp. TAE3-ERU30]MBV7302248.1 monovalent cation/H+ antiporter subunit D family protein [Corynebacterium sp. TAE3-ERU2]
MDIVLPLFVAIPLLIAGIATLLPNKTARDALHLIVPAGTIIAGLWLFSYTAEHGPIAHNVGKYVGGVAIPFVADPFSAVMIVTTAIVALSANWFATTVGETRARFYPALTLMLQTGINGALLTGDLFNFFVFMEVMLLPSYGLLAMTGTWSRMASGRLFVLVNLTASTLLLIGVGILYGVAGSVNIAALAGAGAGNGPVTVALGIVMIALAIKAGVFPVHTWLPRTYPGSSAAVMALFSGLHTKVAVYMIFRIYTVIFDLDDRWNTLIIVVMVASMLVGGFAGLAEHTIRRVLAYQMVNGMPFILVMLAFTTLDPQRALAAGLLYALHHMITIGALTLTSGAIEETYGTGRIIRLSGLMRRDPLVAAIFAAGSFSIVGFPPLSGLWGKLFIMAEVARPATTASWIVITTIIVASMGALLSMLRVWRKVFWGKPMQTSQFPADYVIAKPIIAPAAVMILLSFAMFIFAGTMFDVVLTASEGLLDVSSYQQAVLDNFDQAVGVVAGAAG